LQEEEAPGVLERLQSYVVKATREAMVHTRWTRPNLAHEEGLTKFAASILHEKENGDFLEDFRGFHRRLAFYGMLNSLSQTLLKITAPGVPDFYQGSELWDLRLVDPDNRGTVDFERRIKLLQDIQQPAASGTPGGAAQLYESWTDGRIKLFVVWKALQLRQKLSGLFTDGEFVPAEVSGERAANVTAFFRISGQSAALVIAPKWLATLDTKTGASARQEFWADTRISFPVNLPGSWQSAFTGESIQGDAAGSRAGIDIAAAIGDFPVALLSNRSN
jgi:(1->4)-alpha-D-glucan 1-alpha-D-glucosylmutase